MTWSDVSIGQWIELQALRKDFEDSVIDAYTYRIGIIDVLFNIDSSSLPFIEFQKYVDATDFLTQKYNPQPVKATYTVDGTVYRLLTDVSTMTTSQYIDYMKFMELGDDTNLPYLMALLLIPEGKTYGDGYDVGTTAEVFKTHLTVDIMLNISFFFRELLRLCTRDLVFCSIQEATKELKVSNLPMEQRQEVIRRLAELRALIPSAGGGDGLYG